MTGDNNVHYLHSKGVITRQNKGISMNELKTRFIQWRIGYYFIWYQKKI